MCQRLPQFQCFLIWTDSKVSSQWVHIYPLSLKISHPHIMELLESASVELEHPLKFIIRTKGKGGHECLFKLKSVNAAKQFVEKFDGFKMEQNEGRKLKVGMLQKDQWFTRKKIKKLQQSVWLKITNLDHYISEKKLAEYIRKKAKRVLNPWKSDVIQTVTCRHLLWCK